MRGAAPVVVPRREPQLLTGPVLGERERTRPDRRERVTGCRRRGDDHAGTHRQHVRERRPRMSEPELHRRGIDHVHRFETARDDRGIGTTGQITLHTRNHCSGVERCPVGEGHTGTQGERPRREVFRRNEIPGQPRLVLPRLGVVPDEDVVERGQRTTAGHARRDGIERVEAARLGILRDGEDPAVTGLARVGDRVDRDRGRIQAQAAARRRITLGAAGSRRDRAHESNRRQPSPHRRNRHSFPPPLVVTRLSFTAAENITTVVMNGKGVIRRNFEPGGSTAGPRSRTRRPRRRYRRGRSAAAERTEVSQDRSIPIRPATPIEPLRPRALRPATSARGSGDHSAERYLAR